MDLLKKLEEQTKSQESYKNLQEKMSYEDYLNLVDKNPMILRSSFQRMTDMIMSYGYDRVQDGSEEIKKYKFFEDPFDSGKDAIFGIDSKLNKIVNFFTNAANYYGQEKRLLLLHGPVGSAKSSITRLLKKGLEHYSRVDEGALYTYEWIDKDNSDILGGQSVFPSPMNEEPLKLLPQEYRDEIIKGLKLDKFQYKELKVKGDLNPACEFILKKYLEKYDGDLEQVLTNHIRVKRMIVSEKNRIGIGTFQPKDEKNQDSTELTGDVNYRKIALYGSDSDPRAFNFDGEFNVANRGLIEFVEMLKLETAFLYDLLGASQEQMIKPKKFPQTRIDEVIIGHTNEPEFRKLQNNEFMEALRDRTVKIDIPYNTRHDDEVRIYKKDFNNETSKIHIAPHTIEIASLFSVLTRLEAPSNNLTLLQKLKLYNGKKIHGFNEDSVKEMRNNTKREGLEGISPRYIQDKISNAIIRYQEEGYVSPFMVLKELKDGLKNHGLINSEDQRDQYLEALTTCQEELDQRLKNDVRSALTVDEKAITTLCSNYIDNVKAYTQREKIRNKYSGKLEEADERFMRSIEEKIDIPESRKDDFRRETMNYIGALAIEGKHFDYKENERLHKALELKLFEDQKDQLRLSNVTTHVMDKDSEEKINILKDRLMKSFGYCDRSASDAINYVSSLLAKGNKEEL